MNNIELNIWGKTYALGIVFDCHGNDEPTEKQKQALVDFLKHPEWIEQSKDMVISFSRKLVHDYWGEEIPDNIFSYVFPQDIYIKRELDYPRVAIMCSFDYDPEHGLAIVFEHNGEITVGIQDIII